jgi:hypothetical protein
LSQLRGFTDVVAAPRPYSVTVGRSGFRTRP